MNRQTEKKEICEQKSAAKVQPVKISRCKNRQVIKVHGAKPATFLGGPTMSLSSNLLSSELNVHFSSSEYTTKS